MYQINMGRHRLVVRANWATWHIFWVAQALLVAFFVCLTAINGFSVYWQNRSLQHVVEEKRELQGRFATMQASLPSQVQQTLIQSRLEDLKKKIEKKKAYLNFFAEENLGNQEGFSQYLMGLATHWVEGLALSRLTIKEGGNNMELYGQAQDGAALPELLDRLGADPRFKNMTFKNFKMQRDTDGKQLHYTVQSGRIAHMESKP